MNHASASITIVSGFAGTRGKTPSENPASTTPPG
jgi:hypothetical protein